MTGYNFELICGQSYCLQARALASDGSSLDLTNYGVRGGAKYKFSDNRYALNLNPSVVNATGGFIQLNISGFQTSGLVPTVLNYDVEAFTSGISGDNNTLKILRGYIEVWPETSVF